MRKVGMEIRKLWEKDHGQDDLALQVAKKYGGTDPELSMGVAEKWKAKLYKLLRVEFKTEGMHLRGPQEFKSPLDADLMDAWGLRTKDHEQSVGRWIREGAPLGKERKVPESNGILPTREEGLDPESEPSPEPSEMRRVRSHMGGKDAPGQMEIQLSRFLEKGFAKEISRDQLRIMFGLDPIPQVVIKSQKTQTANAEERLLVRRDVDNEVCKAIVHERATCPRANDVVEMIRSLHEQEHKHHEDAWEVGIPKPTQATPVEKELMVVRVADLYNILGIHPEELRHCVSPSQRDTHRILWTTFWPNHQAGSVVLGRVMALTGRLLQSMFAPSEAQFQVYMDEIVVVTAGSRQGRESKLALILYTLTACGFDLLLQEGERGKRVSWMNTQIAVTDNKVQIRVPEELIQAVTAALQDWSTKELSNLEDLQSLLGRLSWCSGVNPRMKWGVSALYALMADAEQDEVEEKAGARHRNLEGEPRSRRNCIHVKRLGSAMQWLLAMLRVHQRFISRELPLVLPKPTWAIVTDASPQGVGAILVHVGTDAPLIIEGMQCIITEEVAKVLKVEFNTAASQTVLETLAVVRAVKLWGEHLAGKSMVIKSHCPVALAMNKRLSYSHISLSYLAAELALDLERLSIPQMAGKHLPGQLNSEAEFLSRPEEVQFPDTLKEVKIRRVDAFPMADFHVGPPGLAGGWVGATPHPIGPFFRTLSRRCRHGNR